MKCSRVSSKRHLALLEFWVVHIICMALNFLHANGRHVPLEVLRRPPSPEQCNVFARRRGLVLACRRQSGNIPVCAGRRGAQAPAFLSDVSKASRHLGPDMLLRFLEPAVLRTFEPGEYPHATFEREDPQQVRQLLKGWDAGGLLKIVPAPPCKVPCPCFWLCHGLGS